MKSATAVLLVTVLAAFAIGCGGVEIEPDFDLAVVRALIEEKNEKFTRAHVTGEVEIINDYFTEDAKIFAPNADLVTGSADIAALNEAWVGYGITEFTEKTTTVYGGKDLLVEEGTYFLTYGEDGIVERGKYINIWKPEKGDWKVHSNIWNSSMPAPQ